MAKNGALNRAGIAKEDDFYTRMSDIEKELKHYKGHFRDKVVFCNCDDAETSNFWKYFVKEGDQHLGTRAEQQPLITAKRFVRLVAEESRENKHSLD